MPVNTTYPGVYVEELQSAVRTITGVPTAVAAFVGLATRGPVNAATHITSWADFERIFGGLSESNLMSYAVFHFYQNGGSEAEIVRVVTEEKTATIELAKGVTLAVKIPGEAGNRVRVGVDHVAGDQKSYTLTLRDPGAQNPSDVVVTVSTDRTASNTLSAVLANSGLVSVPADSKQDVLPDETPKPDATTAWFTDPADPTKPKTFKPATGGANGATFATLRLPLAGDSQPAGASLRHGYEEA